MMQYVRRIRAVLLAGVLAILAVSWNTGTAYAADSTVRYEGGAEDFVFLPGAGGEGKTDLFGGFKDVMPGDVLTQTIEVRNQASGPDYVDIYLRAKPHDGSIVAGDGRVAGVTMSEFLSKLSLKVYQDGKMIYDASPGALDVNAEPVLLGSFDYNTSAVITVELAVPIELGNEYANKTGVVDWVFFADHMDYPEDPPPGGGGGGGGGGSSGDDDPTGFNLLVLPMTGDMMSAWPYLLLLLIGICGLGYTMVRSRKAKK